MPSPTTALQIIEDALDLTNAVGADETLTNDEVATGLRTLNDLLEIFSTRNLAVYGQANQTFNTVVGTKTYTIGTGGTWNTTRPERIGDVAYSTINTVTFPCGSMTQEEYNLIAVKDQTQDWPYRFLYVNEFPLGLVTLWPVPSAVTPVTFSIDRQLTAISNAAATISFPPGYAMVFKYKLAVMLSSSFGTQISKFPDVVATSVSAFADICRANKKKRVMNYDPALLQNGYSLGQYYRGW